MSLAKSRLLIKISQVEHEGDLIAVLVFVAIDLVVNILMISGANKDYTGRRKDLR